MSSVGLPASSESPRVGPRFGLRAYRAAAHAILSQCMAVCGFFFVGLQFRQLILGDSPLMSAVALGPVAAVGLPASTLTPR
ncbi:hypothetical protein PUR33_00175, partial [Streptomyces sp. BE282]|nr:hypothetical protein [Streptomyces sp. BE282]